MRMQRLLTLTLLFLLPLSACTLPERGQSGPTELPVAEAANPRVDLPPLHASLPFEPGPAGENALTLGPVLRNGLPLPVRITTTHRLGGIDVMSAGEITGLAWLADEQVILRWGESLFLVGLADGAVTPIRGYDRVAGATPDGEWVIYTVEREAFAWAVHVRTGERWTLRLPPETVRWLAPDLATFGYGEEEGHGLIDLAGKGQITMGNPVTGSLRLSTGAICYGATVGEYVICHPEAGAKPLVLTSYRPGIGLAAGAPVPDPSNTRIAYVDRLGKEPRRRVSFTATAYATKPMPANPWVDTLLVYDAAAGRVKRYPMQEASYVQQVLWSPDGSTVGVRVQPGDPEAYRREQVAQFLLLRLETGEWTDVGHVEDENAALERVFTNGVLIRQGAEWQQLSVGATPRAWQPGSRGVEPLAPETAPISGTGRDLLVLSGQELTLHAASGETLTWTVGNTAVKRAAVSPDRRWAAVLTPENDLRFIRRD